MADAAQEDVVLEPSLAAPAELQERLPTAREDEPAAGEAAEPAPEVSPEQLDAGPRQVDAVEAEAEAPTASKLEEALPEEAPPQDAFTQAQGVIRGRLKKLLLGTEGLDFDFLTYSVVADLLPSADVAWDELGLDWYTIGVRLDRLLHSSGPEGGDTWENLWLVLSAEPTDMELEVAKLRALFEANRNSKLERWEIEKGVQREGLSLEALQMPPALMGEFVIGEVEGEPGWTLEKFLEWFQIQRDRLAAAEADEAAQAERAEAEEAKRRARKTQEAALLSRLSLYDANSDAEEEEEALSRNRVAEVSQWAAKDVADWVANEVGLPQYRICFEANNFHGGRLLALTMDTLPRLSIRQFDHCKLIMNGVRSLKGIREKRVETLRDLKLGLRFEPPPQIHDTLKTLRFGSTMDYQREDRIVQEAYTRPVLL